MNESPMDQSIVDQSIVWKVYVRTGITLMTDWTPDYNMQHVSVSEADQLNGSPKLGDKIARSETNGNDQWLVNKKYFNANYVLITTILNAC